MRWRRVVGVYMGKLAMTIKEVVISRVNRGTSSRERRRGGGLRASRAARSKRPSAAVMLLKDQSCFFDMIIPYTIIFSAHTEIRTHHAATDVNTEIYKRQAGK